MKLQKACKHCSFISEGSLCSNHFQGLAGYVIIVDYTGRRSRSGWG